MSEIKHNHITRDIKPLGECPACDDYHDKHIPKSKKEKCDKCGSTEFNVVRDMTSRRQCINCYNSWECP